MKALYIKDEGGNIVHLTEFHEHTEEGGARPRGDSPAPHPASSCH